jgi:hypothetical protein
LSVEDFSRDIRVAKLYVDTILNKDGDTLLAIQAGPRSAYTQTYATADKTHADLTSATLTAASGTADGTVSDVGAAFNQTTLNNNFQECATQINALRVDLVDLKNLVNSLIDDLQALGLVG